MFKLDRFRWTFTDNSPTLQMPKRVLGQTGYQVGLLSLGGQGALERQKKKDTQIELIQHAHALGVNYFDTSPVYGSSELFYGLALEGIREEVFLATKTDDRSRAGSLRLLERSLKRLRTGYVDLWQIHNISSIAEVNEVTRKGGALEALLEMYEQGVVRSIGITGHECPMPLLELMRRHRFDTVLCPVNAADLHVPPSFIRELLPVARGSGMGVIGMKVFGQGYIFGEGGLDTASEALRYSLSQPVDTVIVGCDSIEQLEENVQVAKNFRQMSDEEMRDLEGRTSLAPERGQFFRKKFGGYDSQKKLGKPDFPCARKISGMTLEVPRGESFAKLRYT